MANMINTNIASLNAQNNLNKSQGALTTSLQRLSSGLRINSAKDDSAGMAIVQRMTSQISGNDQAARNANDAISLTQTAEGDLNTISDSLQRMRELAVQASSSSNSASDRVSIDNEVQSLSAEIDRIAKNSSFNGNKLLDGSFADKSFQVGANSTANDSVAVTIASATTGSLGSYFGINDQAVGTSITNNATASTLKITLGGTGGEVIDSPAVVATDAKAIADSINSMSVNGLTATAQATEVAAGTSATTGTAGASTFTINGTTMTLTNSTDAVTNRANALSVINAQSASTGVVASDTGSGLKLTATDGRNITTTFAAGTSTGATTADYGLAAAGTKTSNVKVTYVRPDGSGISSVAFSGAGITGPVAGTLAKTGTSISATNVLTADKAKNALNSIDAAISSVNTSKAALGVYQNRFASVVSNLQSTSENLTASRSRIQDTDFAKETASLTRGQILQQAGTAMLAQANSLPNGVMALLR